MSEFQVEVLRSLTEIETRREAWERTPWMRELAEYPYYVASADGEGVSGPFAVLVRRDGEVAAAAVGRIETKRLPAAIGYLRLHSPRLRILQLTAGGVVVRGSEAAGVLGNALRDVLAAGEADALAVPALPVDSPEYEALVSLGGPLERQRFVAPWTRRRLVLPATFDEFLASRSKKVRFGIRYDGKRLLEALGDVSVAVLDRPEQLDQLAHDVDTVARLTYQRALGVGFVDTDEQRRLARIGLEHGWTRAYVLRHDERPIAYWLCSVHRGTMLLRTTGYDPEYAAHRPGIYLLMRAIEHACGDPAVQVVDFGPGRSSYKRHFGSETYQERNLLVFAPTVRGRSVNLVRTAVAGTGRTARWVLDRAGVTDRLKRAWRQRLRARAT